MTHVPDSLSSRRTMSEVAERTGSLADAFGDRTPAAGLRGGEPSVQDAFLNNARRDRVPVTVHLMTGRSFDARIKGFDRYAVLVDVSGAEHLVFKHAIAFIETARAAVNAFAAPHS
jgi:host factor-I protein